MAHCIICEKPIIVEGDEHVIPYAIGGRLIMHQVCTECNSKLGDKVDFLLTDDPFIIFLRHTFNIKTRDNKPVNIIKSFPFFDSNGNPLIIKRDPANQLPPLYDGTQKPEVIFTRLSDREINMTYSGSDIPSIVSKAKREAKKANVTIDEEKLKDIIKHGTSTCTTTKAITNVTTDLKNYIPCITKITYEIGYMLFHEQYLQDKRGKELQRFLYDFINDQWSYDFPSDVRIDIEVSKLSKMHSITLKLENRIAKLIIVLFGGIQISIPLTYDAQNYNLENIIDSDLIFLLKQHASTNNK